MGVGGSAPPLPKQSYLGLQIRVCPASNGLSVAAQLVGRYLGLFCWGAGEMPTLESDFVGRVNRLPLRPTDKSALMPLMEAVSNSIHAITERFGDEAGKRGRVDVRVIRDLQNEDEPIVGFDIEDNGIGFTHDNYKSFLTPDSRHKEKRGGKGVGRLAWLKVFEEVEVDSCYHEGGELHHRHFKFRLATSEQVQLVKSSKLPEKSGVQTKVSFRGFDGRYATRCPSKQGTIALRILSHFVPLFISGRLHAG